MSKPKAPDLDKENSEKTDERKSFVTLGDLILKKEKERQKNESKRKKTVDE